MTVGRLPVENFLIETIYDSNDKRLNVFREKIFEQDLLIDKKYLQEDKPHKWWLETFNVKIAEDAYKFCDRKWHTLGFNNIEAIVEDNEIVGISGCKIYGNYLRTSMHLYLLKKVRKKYPGIKYIKGGWFDRHILYAKKQNSHGMFFTVYAYSNKLKALINNHTKKTISLIDKSYLQHMDKITCVGEYQCNNVKQTFFYFPLLNYDFNINEVINE